LDSQTSTLLATVLVQAGAGGVTGFMIGYGVRQVAGIMLKVSAAAFALLAIPLAGLMSIGVLKVDWQALAALLEKAIAALAQGIAQMIPTLTQALPATGAFTLGFAGGLMKK
jgi:uncharacterized membrane protein (Fun14 family)